MPSLRIVLGSLVYLIVDYLVLPSCLSLRIVLGSVVYLIVDYLA